MLGFVEYMMVTLTHEKLETHGCILKTAAADALVLKAPDHH